jgi:hypothetical protein
MSRAIVDAALPDADHDIDFWLMQEQQWVDLIKNLNIELAAAVAGKEKVTARIERFRQEPK